ncbi:transglutaminase family protein [Paracoccus aestuarii]|uniref:Transglutaminase family protein n=1 Tax=Paracoccus aestuarii TaxID=453842 RepID=A0A418ZWS0_9RHOB|nr:transglutaminase family protein [Paracoccus aestuarii]RJL04954.1 transglutaminase family protein [Paracoccus aestuarii]WCQ98298.1 transglutaminase family protein [Paracoccus aestuarii]
MRMKIDVTLDYAMSNPGPALLVIEAAGVQGQVLNRATIDLGNPQKLARVPAEEGIGERLILRVAERLTCRYSAEVEVTRPRPDLRSLRAAEMEDMPGDALRYLLPSRYCQAERFTHFTGSRFEGLTGGALVAEMRDWVERNLDYVAGASDGNTTAADTFLDRRGVCRDYAHLLVALCRAAQIPARIASVYAPPVHPQDFHAVAQVYLNHEWHLVDPTGMATADQMALVAVGRDATDVAFLTTVSDTELVTQRVEVTPL